MKWIKRTATFTSFLFITGITFLYYDSSEQMFDREISRMLGTEYYVHDPEEDREAVPQYSESSESPSEGTLDDTVAESKANMGTILEEAREVSEKATSNVSAPIREIDYRYMSIDELKSIIIFDFNFPAIVPQRLSAHYEMIISELNSEIDQVTETVSVQKEVITMLREKQNPICFFMFNYVVQANILSANYRNPHSHGFQSVRNILEIGVL